MNFLGVFGHVNIDYLMSVKELPQPNTCTEVSDVKRHFGGTGANIAMVASSLGVSVALASFVGTDFPADFKAALMKAGVDITDLVEAEGQVTPTCRIMTDPDANQIGIMDQGPMACMNDYEIARHTIESSEIIHIGTGRPAYYRRVMELAAELKKPIYFDPAQEIHYVYDAEAFRELLELANVMFANKSELATALRYLGEEDETALLEHVDTLIITEGAEGSRILHGNDIIRIPAIKPESIVDPTGAGDAYRAGFYAGLSRGNDLEKSGNLGASAASFIIETEGPMSRLPTWEEVLGRAER